MLSKEEFINAVIMYNQPFIFSLVRRLEEGLREVAYNATHRGSSYAGICISYAIKLPRIYEDREFINVSLDIPYHKDEEPIAAKERIITLLNNFYNHTLQTIDRRIEECHEKRYRKDSFSAKLREMELVEFLSKPMNFPQDSNDEEKSTT